jgi:glucose-1-phosphate thymidylyltransferase
LIKNDVKTRNEYQLTDALDLMMKTGESFKAITINEWYDCGTVDTLLSTSSYLLSKKSVNNGECENCKIIEPVYIGKGANISNSSIGPNVAIGEKACVQGSIISDSMINDYAQIRDSELENSIVGYRSRVVDYKGSVNIGDDEII